MIERYPNNPFITPKNGRLASFNSAIAKFNGGYVALYRTFGPEGQIIRSGKKIIFQRKEGISMFGLAILKLKNNYLYVEKDFDEPVFAPDKNSKLYGYETMGIEDPRATPIKALDKIFITYLATFLRGNELVGKPALASTNDFSNFKREGLINIDGYDNTKNVVLFPEKINGKFALLHRPNKEKSIYVAFSDDLTNYDNSRFLIGPRKNSWDSFKVGACSPPTKLDDNWLLMYHGVNKNRVYSLGFVLLDKNLNPTARSTKPEMWPEEPYEKEGIVNNVIFSCGSVIENGFMHILYGAADRVIGGAKISLEEIINNSYN